MLNIPLGTFTPDGLRTGPVYPNSLPGGTYPNTFGVVTSGSNYTQYGPGILLAPYGYLSMTPNAPGDTFSVFNNVVAAVTPTGAGTLPLVQDKKVTYSITSQTGNQYLQLDYPRVIGITLSGVNEAAPIRVTVFGFDLYDNPVQHTTIIQDVGDYPIILFGSEGVEVGNFKDPAGNDLTPVAFYKVTEVYISSGLAAGNTISLGAYDIFGLPFRVNANKEGAASFSLLSWDDIEEKGIYLPPVTPTDAWIPITLAGAFQDGETDQTLPTAGDVRGLYAPSTPASGTKSLVAIYYVQGADVLINQRANAQQNQDLTLGYSIGAPVNYLNITDLYGVLPFYTGEPS